MINEFDALNMKIDVSFKPGLKNVKHRYICIIKDDKQKKFSNITRNAIKFLQKTSGSMDGVVLIEKKLVPELNLRQDSYLILSERYIINDKVSADSSIDCSNLKTLINSINKIVKPIEYNVKSFQII